MTIAESERSSHARVVATSGSRGSQIEGRASFYSEYSIQTRRFTGMHQRFWCGVVGETHIWCGVSGKKCLKTPAIVGVLRI